MERMDPSKERSELEEILNTERMKTRVVAGLNLVLLLGITVPSYICLMTLLSSDPNSPPGKGLLTSVIFCVYLFYYIVHSILFIISTTKTELTHDEVRILAKEWLIATLVMTNLDLVLLVIVELFTPGDNNDVTTARRMVGGALVLKILAELGFIFVARKYIISVSEEATKYIQWRFNNHHHHHQSENILGVQPGYW